MRTFSLLEPRVPHRGIGKGFTLVELLVVLSIIALLFALLLPALGAARNSAKLTQCATNLKGMGVGAGAYQADYNEQYGFRSKKVVTGNGFGSLAFGWDYLLWPYMRPEAPGYVNGLGVPLASGSWPAQYSTPFPNWQCPFDQTALMPNGYGGTTAAPVAGGPPVTNFNSYNIVCPVKWNGVGVDLGVNGFYASRGTVYFNTSSAGPNGARRVAQPSEWAYIFDGSWPRRYTPTVIVNGSYVAPVQGIGHAVTYGAMIATLGSNTFQWDCPHPITNSIVGPWGQGQPNVLYGDFHVSRLSVLPKNLDLNSQLPFRVGVDGWWN